MIQLPCGPLCVPCHGAPSHATFTDDTSPHTNIWNHDTCCKNRGPACLYSKELTYLPIQNRVEASLGSVSRIPNYRELLTVPGLSCRKLDAGPASGTAREPSSHPLRRRRANSKSRRARVWTSVCRTHQRLEVRVSRRLGLDVARQYASH